MPAKKTKETDELEEKKSSPKKSSTKASEKKTTKKATAKSTVKKSTKKGKEVVVEEKDQNIASADNLRVLENIDVNINDFNNILENLNSNYFIMAH